TREALEQYRTVVVMYPDYSIGWYTLANFLRDNGMYAGAAEADQRGAPGGARPRGADRRARGRVPVRPHPPAQAGAALRGAGGGVERPDRPRGSMPGGGGTPHLMLAAALYETGDYQGCRAALLKGAQYPQRRQEALERLAELDAEMAERRKGSP